MAQSVERRVTNLIDYPGALKTLYNGAWYHEYKHNVDPKIYSFIKNNESAQCYTTTCWIETLEMYTSLP